MIMEDGMSWPNRCGTPLGSAQRLQMKTISKNIINSSNDMKTKTSKCHTCFAISSAFIVHAMFARVSSFKNNYITISASLCVFLYAALHSTKFPKSSPHKVVISKRMTALQTFRIENINAKQIQLPTHASSLSFKIGKTYKICFL